MSTSTATPRRVLRIWELHHTIERQIDAYPHCPRTVSYAVDRCLVEAEALAWQVFA